MSGPRGARPGSPGGDDPARWWNLALLSVALLLGMCSWFAATAVAPQLAARWSLAPERVTLLTTLVQWGFVAGTATAAILNLADVVRSRFFFAACAIAAAVANLSLLAVPGGGSAGVARFLTGFFLAGVYPPAMKMVATWFRSARGLAIGTVVGALTAGKGLPYLLKGLGEAPLVAVVGGTSLAGVSGAVLVLAFYRDGPHRFESRPFAWSRVGELLRHRPTMLATGGYLGHMWELYAAWTLWSAFNAEAFARPDLWTFLMISVGAVGCVQAGRVADRVGRVHVANGAMWISGACCLVAGWTLGLPTWVTGAVGLVWGLTIVADSAQFSAVVTEVAPSHAVGTALTLQTMLGFALTGVSIEVASRVHLAAGWPAAFSLLALGPVAGILSMRALARTGAVRG
ncbi:MAG TPA: MFS transporter [Longimicrobiales bacterium]|nr:MFS transporter [Longimicrobiales bacterium]